MGSDMTAKKTGVVPYRSAGSGISIVGSACFTIFRTHYTERDSNDDPETWSGSEPHKVLIGQVWDVKRLTHRPVGEDARACEE